jgi:hypothetical protein
MNRIVLIALAALSLGACASNDMGGFQTASTPQGPSVISGSGATSMSGGPVGASTPVVAGPAGCAGPISDYQQLIDNDAETGMLNPGVYNRVSVDLENVKKACASGREKEALGQLASVKARYGYR